MFNFFINFFNKSQNQNDIFNKQYSNDIFNKEYRKAYNKLWIEQLRNYSP